MYKTPPPTPHTSPVRSRESSPTWFKDHNGKTVTPLATASQVSDNNTTLRADAATGTKRGAEALSDGKNNQTKRPKTRQA